MMDWTDRFDRYFLRTMSKHTWLYTEMVTTGAIIFGDQVIFLHIHIDFQMATKALSTAPI
jgi:tRNA-dihydrouridine synthase A